MDPHSQWEKALSLLDEMRNERVKPNTIVYSAAISACGVAGEWEAALEVLKRMRAQRVQPNTITYVGEVSTFVKSFGEVTDDGGHFSNRYNAAIQACDRGGVWQRAVELFDAMEVEGIARDAITYNAIAQACQRAGQWDLAKEYRERALHRSGARAARGPNEVWR